MASNQSLKDLIRMLRESLTLTERQQRVATAQAFISGALTGGMVPHQNYPAPDLEVDSEELDDTECLAWADTAEAMNDNANWDAYTAPGEGN